MIPQLKKTLLSIAFVTVTTLSGIAQHIELPTQEFPGDYIKVTQQRGEKIVNKMNLKDSAKAERVVQLIAQHYQDQTAIHDHRDEELERIDTTYKHDENLDHYKGKTEAKAEKQLAYLQFKFINNLEKELTAPQIEHVKDGFTYHVVPNTYKRYTELLPQMTFEQKQVIMAYLKKARDEAMTKGSSHEKHAAFNQYKGKINNYISQEGYNLSKAEERLREKENK